MDPRIDFLRTMRAFASLATSDLERLTAGMRAQEFRRHQLVFQQGEPGTQLYIVERGRMRAFTTGPDGQELTVNLFLPGDMFGEQSLLDGLPRSASVEAQTPTRALVLGREYFQACLRASPGLSEALLALLSIRLRVTTAYAESLITLDLRGRLASLLLRLAQQYGQPDPSGTVIALGMSQGEMATIVGASRESLNRVLGALRDEGLIDLVGRTIVVRIPERLRLEIGEAAIR